MIHFLYDSTYNIYNSSNLSNIQANHSVLLDTLWPQVCTLLSTSMMVELFICLSMHALAKVIQEFVTIYVMSRLSPAISEY
jgi:hypothetical protein